MVAFFLYNQTASRESSCNWLVRLGILHNSIKYLVKTILNVGNLISYSLRIKSTK